MDHQVFLFSFDADLMKTFPRIDSVGRVSQVVLIAQVFFKSERKFFRLSACPKLQISFRLSRATSAPISFFHLRAVPVDIGHGRRPDRHDVRPFLFLQSRRQRIDLRHP
jgi:hypothetical protein